MKTREFRVLVTGHGPVIRSDAQGRPVSIELMNTPVKALEQSYLRTKARSYAEYRKTMELMANSSEQHDLCGCGRRYCVLAWQLHSAAGSAVRLYEAGGWDGSGYGLEGVDGAGRDSAVAEPGERVAVQRERFAVEWGGGELAEEGGLPCLRGARDRECAWGACDAGADAGKDWTVESLRAAAFDSYLPWFARTYRTGEGLGCTA